MGLETFENIEKIPEWVETENISKPIEAVEPDLNDFKSDSKESVESFKSGLEKTEFVTDLEMTEGITDYLETVSEFRYENWTKLSLEERTDVLNRVEQKIAEIEHRPALSVGIEEMGRGDLGYQCASEKRIALNSKIVGLNTPEAHRLVVETIIHEGRHAYQHYNVDVKCIHESASEVKTWEKNFYDPVWGYYQYHGQKIYAPNNKGQLRDIGFILYEQQPVEVDARNFTSDISSKLESKGIIKSESEILTSRQLEPSLENMKNTSLNNKELSTNMKLPPLEVNLTKEDINKFHFYKKMGEYGNYEDGDLHISLQNGIKLTSGNHPERENHPLEPYDSVNIYQDHYTEKYYIKNLIGENSELHEATKEQKKEFGVYYVYTDFQTGALMGIKRIK